MVMPPRPRPSSSGMQSIRRELQRQRPKPLAPKSSAAMKPPAPPPPPPCESARCTSREPRPRPPSEEIPFSVAVKSRCRAGTDAPRPRPHASLRPPVASRPTPPSRCAISSPRSPRRATTSTSTTHLRPGTAVGVRTRTTTLKTGEALVLWLRATVVSPTHRGYEVIYDGNWLPADPYGTVRVPLRHVRLIKANPSPTTPPPPLSCAAVPAAQKRETQPAPRPTRAGKSLRLIRRSLLPEMERQARDDSHGCY